MIVFENDGEIDPRLITLIGVNVKESDSAIGFFGTGLKYSVACMARWGESLVIQSGESQWSFATEKTQIRGKDFTLISMMSRFDRAQLGFTTELGKNWKPWMVYRELWCNAQDEPNPRVYEATQPPSPSAGVTRVIVRGKGIEEAHRDRNTFILDKSSAPLHTVSGLEIYAGKRDKIFYRGIAVQHLEKPSLYTYNITKHLDLTEDRTAGQWSTDYCISNGLAKLESEEIIDATLTAGPDYFESRLDYGYLHSGSGVWETRAKLHAKADPHSVPSSVRNKYVVHNTKRCPTCNQVIVE